MQKYNFRYTGEINIGKILIKQTFNLETLMFMILKQMFQFSETSVMSIMYWPTRPVRFLKPDRSDD